MLKKKFCTRCYENRYTGQDYGHNYLERDWEKGYVICPPNNVLNSEWTWGIQIEIYNKPPEQCPYILEQILC